MLRFLPNALTLLRLALALPLGLLIWRGEFALALAVGFVAGLTDTLDGVAARRLGAFSRFGAALDPIADKTLITVFFLTAATVGLVPWHLALVVVLRDLVIMGGAACYALLYGPFEFAATRLSKFNMFVQLCFALLVLTAQVTTVIPAWVIPAGTWLVIALAVASGLDYIVAWGIRALQAGGEREGKR